MKYDFNMILNRKSSGSLKWDLRERQGGPDILPMWVADMDFESPREVVDALVKRAEHGIFGYTYCSDSYYDSIIDWMEKRNQWRIKREWIITTPGIVTALGVAILAYTDPGDRILIQPPVYHPFKRIILANNRVPVENQLITSGNRYRMDYSDLERVIQEDVSMLVLCSPHNPVGRVWKKDELLRLADICIQNNVLIISDEIHSDLILPGYRHHVMAALSDDIAQRTVTFTSGSKTFNLAGLACSNIIISNRELFESFNRVIKSLAIVTPNIFGLVATEAAYRFGEEWLGQLITHIEKNYDFLKSFLTANIPDIGVTPLEGSYLAWLDFRKLGLSDDKINEMLLDKAGVWLDNGPQFGSGGEGFQRINLACSRDTLKEGLNRIATTIREI
jgi:cystathionine beta-lyase